MKKITLLMISAPLALFAQNNELSLSVIPMQACVDGIEYTARYAEPAASYDAFVKRVVKDMPFDWDLGFKFWGRACSYTLGWFHCGAHASERRMSAIRALEATLIPNQNTLFAGEASVRWKLRLNALHFSKRACFSPMEPLSFTAEFGLGAFLLEQKINARYDDLRFARSHNGWSVGPRAAGEVALDLPKRFALYTEGALHVGGGRGRDEVQVYPYMQLGAGISWRCAGFLALIGADMHYLWRQGVLSSHDDVHLRGMKFEVRGAF